MFTDSSRRSLILRAMLNFEGHSFLLLIKRVLRGIPNIELALDVASYGKASASKVTLHYSAKMMQRDG